MVAGAWAAASLAVGVVVLFVFVWLHGVGHVLVGP
jgi:hypothetical protein